MGVLSIAVLCIFAPPTKMEHSRFDPGQLEHALHDGTFSLKVLYDIRRSNIILGLFLTGTLAWMRALVRAKLLLHPEKRFLTSQRIFLKIITYNKAYVHLSTARRYTSISMAPSRAGVHVWSAPSVSHKKNETYNSTRCSSPLRCCNLRHLI